MTQIIYSKHNAIIPTAPHVSYVYHIDVEGTGGETCFAPVPDRLVPRFKARAPKQLADMVQEAHHYNYVCGGLLAQMPRGVDHELATTHWGVDAACDHSVTVRDRDNQVLAVARFSADPQMDFGFRRPVSEAEFELESYQELAVRYTLELDEPLCLTEIRPNFTHLNGRSLIDGLMYCGKSHSGVYRSAEDMRAPSARLLIHH
jgi:hypothetical protein